MLILAIEQSNEYGSVALLQDDHLLGELGWMDSRRHSQQLFVRLTELLEQNSISLSRIDCYAVGLGPGSYTGLRMAVAAVRGLAMPDSRQVYGISSAEALAETVMTELGVSSVMVIGDARRHQLWSRVFALRAGHCLAVSPWRLGQPEVWATEEGQASVWVTPDWKRIGPLLKAQVPSGRRLIEKRRISSAGAVGHGVFRRIRAAIPSEPLKPIYLHPAVTAPRAGTHLSKTPFH